MTGGPALKTKNLTLSAWVKLRQAGSNDDADDSTIFSTAGSSTTHSRLWYDVNADTIGSRTFSFTLGSPAALFNRTSGTDGVGIADKWQLLVAVMNEDQRSLYLDGFIISNASSPTSSISLEGSDARIGSWDEDSASEFNGLVDELRIYNISFAQADIDLSLIHI